MRPPPKDRLELDDGATPARRGAVVALLVALTCTAALLRLTGIDFLLPSIVEPDGGVLPYQLDRIERRYEEPKRDFYAAFYPSLVTQFARLAPSRDAERPAAQPPTLEQARASSVDLNLRVRRTVAVLSAFSVPLTYGLARHFLSRGWSLVAAAFLATSFLQQWFAQQSRPHAAATTFFTLALLAALYLRRQGTWLAYLFAGATLGLAIGALQNGVALLFPLLGAVWWCERRGAARAWVAASLLLAAFVGQALYLGAGSDQPLTRNEPLLAYDAATNALKISGHAVALDAFDFSGARIVWNALWCYEPTLTLACLAAFALLIARYALNPGGPLVERRGEVLVVLAFALPYAFVVCLYARSYQRFVIPLLPLLAIFAAGGLAYGAELLRARVRWAALAVAGLPLAANAIFAVNLARVRGTPDTIARAAEWFRDPANFDRERQTIAVLPPIDFPLPHTAESLARFTQGLYTKPYPWTHYQKTAAAQSLPLERYQIEWLPLATQQQRDAIAADPEGFVRGLGADFVVIHVLEIVRFHAAFTAIRGALLREAQLVQRFSPDRSAREREIPLDFEDFEHYEPDPWAWRTLFAESPGPVIEIYRLRRGRGAR